jgi:hypothetical protein
LTDTAKLPFDWLTERGGERLECKEAKSRFSYDGLEEYCAAIANERRELWERPPFQNWRRKPRV